MSYQLSLLSLSSLPPSPVHFESERYDAMRMIYIFDLSHYCEDYDAF